MKHIRTFLTILFVSIILFSGATARAANFSITPSTDKLNINESFTINLAINTENQSINKISGTLSYPSQNIEATSISKANSIINLWTDEPTINNGTGTINFAGLILTNDASGFTGDNGKILTITFTIKNKGIIDLKLQKAAILANDGKGTNLLSEAGTLTLNIGSISPPTTSEPPTIQQHLSPEPKSALPIKIPPSPLKPTPTKKTTSLQKTKQKDIRGNIPTVSSSTHPDPKKWYSSHTASFAWNLLPSVIGVNIVGDHTKGTNPGSKPDGLFSSHTYKKVKDGKWFFHIKFLTKQGWGPIKHFPFNIDTVPPAKIKIKELPTTDKTIQKKFIFSTTDELSGVEKIKIIIDHNDAHVINGHEGVYAIKNLPVGEHMMQVEAFDFAHNKTVVIKNFQTKVIPSTLKKNKPSQTILKKSLSNHPSQSSKTKEKILLYIAIVTLLASIIFYAIFIFLLKISPTKKRQKTKSIHKNNRSSKPKKRLRVQRPRKK